MKKIIFILLVLPLLAGAQKTDSLICKMIRDSLPKNWVAKYDKGIVTVWKKDSVWFYNGMNAPLELTPSDHPPFGAIKGIYKMEITVQPGWSMKQMRSAIRNNSNVMNKIYEKYRMGEIANKNGDYAPANDDEMKRVEAYYKECEQAQSQLKVIPTINTDKNSYVIHTSISDPGFLVWPDVAGGEINSTQAMIYSILRK
jgi:hypothetical protein